MSFFSFLSFILLFSFLVGLGFELRALCLQRKHSMLEPHLQPIFALVFLFFLSFFFFFCGTGVWTHGLMLAGQVLYHLSHSASPTVVIFWRRSLAHYLPGLALNHDPPDSTSQVARISGMSHCTQAMSSFSDLEFILVFHIAFPFMFSQCSLVWEFLRYFMTLTLKTTSQLFCGMAFDLGLLGVFSWLDGDYVFVARIWQEGRHALPQASSCWCCSVLLLGMSVLICW
jgi:hypothetical protein